MRKKCSKKLYTWNINKKFIRIGLRMSFVLIKTPLEEIIVGIESGIRNINVNI